MADNKKRRGSYLNQWVHIIDERKLAMKRDPEICVSQKAWNANYFLWEHPDEKDPASLIIRHFGQHADIRTFYPRRTRRDYFEEWQALSQLPRSEGRQDRRQSGNGLTQLLNLKNDFNDLHHFSIDGRVEFG